MSNEADPFEDMSRRMTDAQNLFTKMWTDMGSKLMDAGMASPPGMPTPDGARQMRTAFFRAWSDYCDELMRSPEFLETMKQSMAGAVEFRRQLNESLGKMHHEFQGTSRQDVDHLMQSMAHVERRVLNAVEGLADRLEEVNARLDALEWAETWGPISPFSDTREIWFAQTEHGDVFSTNADGELAIKDRDGSGATVWNLYTTGTSNGRLQLISVANSWALIAWWVDGGTFATEETGPAGVVSAPAARGDPHHQG